jgi:hypothetical protein
MMMRDPMRQRAHPQIPSRPSFSFRRKEARMALHRQTRDRGMHEKLTYDTMRETGRSANGKKGKLKEQDEPDDNAERSEGCDKNGGCKSVGGEVKDLSKHD